jgi:hypothetical protein
MVDRYTKAVLTVIAGSLAALAIEQAAPAAQAQAMPCGTPKAPCFVANYFGSPLFVKQGAP